MDIYHRDIAWKEGKPFHLRMYDPAGNDILPSGIEGPRAEEKYQEM